MMPRATQTHLAGRMFETPGLTQSSNKHIVCFYFKIRKELLWLVPHSFILKQIKTSRTFDIEYLNCSL